MGEPPTSASVQRPTRVRFGVLGFACTLALVTYLDRICISQVSKPMQDDLGISSEQFGWVFNAFTLGYLLFEIPSGRMGDTWGARRVITRIVLWWSLFTAMTGLLWPFALGTTGWLALINGSFLLLLLVRFLFGCGEAGAFPNLTRAVAVWFPFTERGVALGWIWMSARIGGALAPLAIERLTHFLGGWRPAFWCLGAIGLVWCLFFYRWYRDTPEERPDCNAAERELIRAGPYSWKPDVAGHAVPWSMLGRALLRSSNLWALCVGGAGISFSWYFYATWQPRFLNEVHHLEGATAAIAAGLPFFTGAFGALLGGRLSDRLTPIVGRRWGRSLLGVVALAGAGLAFLAAGLVTNAWLAVFLLCLTTFLNDVTVPLFWAVSADIGGRSAGAVSGLMNMMAGIGPLISQPMMPIWWHAYDWSGMIVILASVWFLSALMWLRIDASEPLLPELEPKEPRDRLLESHEASNRGAAPPVEPARPENEEHFRQ
jgi:MFS family permease